jgi:hypothetical protein
MMTPQEEISFIEWCSRNARKHHDIREILLFDPRYQQMSELGQCVVRDLNNMANHIYILHKEANWDKQ